MKRSLALLLVVVLSLAGAASSWASAGDDQYCDPFSGCATPDKTHQSRHKKSATNKTTRQSPATHSSVVEINTNLSSSKTSPADSFNQAAGKLLKKHQTSKPPSRDAARVLDAAGLSALLWTLP